MELEEDGSNLPIVLRTIMKDKEKEILEFNKKSFAFCRRIDVKKK